MKDNLFLQRTYFNCGSFLYDKTYIIRGGSGNDNLPCSKNLKNKKKYAKKHGLVFICTISEATALTEPRVTGWH